MVPVTSATELVGVSEGAKGDWQHLLSSSNVLEEVAIWLILFSAMKGRWIREGEVLCGRAEAQEVGQEE